MKLIVFVFCLFTVSFGATSRLKAHQVIVNEEQIVVEIPGDSYQLNTINEEQVLAPAPEPEITSTAEPTYVAAPANEELIVYATAEPTYVAKPIYVAAPVNEEQVVVYSNAEPTYVAAPANEELIVYSTAVPTYVANEELIVYSTAVPTYVANEELIIYQENLPSSSVNNEETITYAPPEVQEYVIDYAPVEEAVIHNAEAPVVFQDEGIISYAESDEQPDIPIAGGSEDIPLSQFDQDQDLQNAAQVCIDALLGAARKDGKLTTNADFHISEVNRIQSQVVAGTNYSFDVILATDADADARIYATFTAFSQPWTNTLACTDGCVKIGRMVRV